MIEAGIASRLLFLVDRIARTAPARRLKSKAAC